MPAPCLSPQNEAVAEKTWPQALPLPSAGTSTGGVQEFLFWNPCFNGDVEKLERSGLRFATVVQGLERRYSVREVEGNGLVLPSEEEPEE